ncbi:MAG: hypothetical protein OEM48_01285 [Gammaproteobacteria bacterium]|nr:hypothetical protein [Gammaproteobacteria bacterium]MDH3370707.1 hypothetical protein [Gammaproteobacteria bacterium]MDH3405549.1 hypothetical protein [Gammaproteobacteria bacterium]MDH3562446.1 hypothetical protein [Gammaproteobacteria bacterium]MDH5485992.1 hypothetical protein [Gammaproteobacteria bacterium]
MRSKQLTIFFIVATLAFGFGQTAAFAAGATAKAWLAQAKQTAKKWQADAVLISINTLGADMDGTSSKWGYMFYSPKTKKGYSVDFQGSKTVETLQVSAVIITDSIGDDFMDSDNAMKEAKKHGLKIKDKQVSMTLMVMGQLTKQPCICWTVTGFEKGDVGIMLESRSGKLYRRSEVK